MPRLLHITTVPHTLHFLVGQIGFMQSQGFEVEVASSADEKLDIFLEREPVTHHAVEMSRALSPLRDLQSLRQLVRLLRERQPDIVHAHTPKAGMLSMIAAWITNVPVRIYHVHGLRFATLTGWKRALLISCEKLACRLATQVLCVSRSARSMAIQNQLVDRKKIKVLLRGSINGMDTEGRFNPNNVDFEAARSLREKLNIPQDAVVIGFLGRLVRDKGIEELVAAWQAIRDAAPHARLLIVGDHEPQDPISTQAKDTLDHDPRIHRVGYDPETPRLFATMDIFCLPSYREGLPYVALEASSMQLPVVATRVTGCVDAVEDGLTGTLVTVRDVEALANALLRYLADESLRKWHGAAGRKHIQENFQPTEMWVAMKKEYERQLGFEIAPQKPLRDLQAA
jgi:glycosyltransferase involved in cell wall biosynthesis